jgi:3-oxoacyl-[acyl-carrier-protein] synthase I
MTAASNFDSRYPVSIVGVGARTPLGFDAAASAAAVRAAIPAIREHPYFVDTSGEPISLTMDAGISAELDGVDRLHALALPAMREALAPLGQRERIKARIPTIIGLSGSRPGRPEGLEADLVRRLEAELPIRIRVLPHGHSAGLMALQEAARMINAERTEFCLAGGVDSYVQWDTLAWLDTERQLMSEENRSGFVPGEGAGFCLVASTGVARRRGLDVLAWLVSAATARERNLIKTNDICIGEGLSEAITQAAAALKLPEERVNASYCDLNGERYRSEEFTFSVLRTQSAFVNMLDNVTPADCWGDMGAASGPLFAALAIASAARGYASGPRSMLWTSSEDGHRSAVVLHVPV